MAGDADRRVLEIIDPGRHAATPKIAGRSLLGAESDEGGILISAMPCSIVQVCVYGLLPGIRFPRHPPLRLTLRTSTYDPGTSSCHQQPIHSHSVVSHLQRSRVWTLLASAQAKQPSWGR